MATSDNAVDAVENRWSDCSLFAAMTRYDLILAVIPSVFVVSMLVGHLLDLSAQASIGVASLLGAFAVADALFVNPPCTGER
ncbi:hypothetical protein [Halapricum salinum]|uniref:Uncharacterized protein n=1 Tax=Halapricum salinum TaxID=1457250 RepID=A0A4D6HAR5_9EURY|nr:hypothetical protein [Halapricum salinum]QCC50228.1 hypothetical protein DV733_02810 [Halapricum salinum]